MFGNLSQSKRQCLIAALLIGVGAMLWNMKGVIDDNSDHPWISPENSVMGLRYDENGDPYATPKRAEPIAYAKIWSNPVTRGAFAFIFFLIVGSLVRGLLSGALALVALVAVLILFIGREAVFEFIRAQDIPGAINFAFAWVRDEFDVVKSAALNSFALISSALAGFVVGLKK